MRQQITKKNIERVMAIADSCIGVMKAVGEYEKLSETGFIRGT